MVKEQVESRKMKPGNKERGSIAVRKRGREDRDKT